MKTKKQETNKFKLVLPHPPDDWWSFRRSGRVKEAEIETVRTVQREHPELEQHDVEFLVEAYRSYKRKNLDEICIKRAATINVRVVHERSATNPASGKNDQIEACDRK